MAWVEQVVHRLRAYTIPVSTVYGLDEAQLLSSERAPPYLNG